MTKISEPFIRFADTVGNGTGTKNAAVDASSTTIFLVENTRPKTHLELNRCIIHIEDDASFRAGGYGGLTTLTNGILVRYNSRFFGVVDLTDGIPIKNMSDWGRYCYDVTYQEFQTGNNFVNIRWTWSKAGEPIKLGFGDKVEFVLRDDMDALVGHYFSVQGVWR